MPKDGRDCVSEMMKCSYLTSLFERIDPNVILTGSQGHLGLITLKVIHFAFVSDLFAVIDQKAVFLTMDDILAAESSQMRT